MSRLFDHYGAEGKGYSQPAPLISASELKVPSNMARKQLPRWPRLSEPEMVRHIRGFQSGISESTPDFTLSVLAR